MLQVNVIAQPDGGQIRSVLEHAFLDSQWNDCRAAVAYVRTSGVRVVESALLASKVDCRWLTAIDWCRSDPAALESLDAMKRSSVRIFDGANVMANRSCHPQVPFHPKGFLFTGNNSALLICGSGNLSQNGITSGVELNSVVEIRDPEGMEEQAAWKNLIGIKRWFDAQWSKATPYSTIAGRYVPAFDAAPDLPPASEDSYASSSVTSSRGFTAVQLQRISRARTMWIEAGRLTAATSSSPGHQLMMRPYTRAFFGIEPKAEPRMSLLGTVSIRYGNARFTGLTIEYAHNAMDRLNLPASDGSRPAIYDGRVLLLTKVGTSSGVEFELKVISAAERSRLRARSVRRGLVFAMSSSGRQFGFL